MAKQFFKDLPDTSTPLTAERLNGLLDGEEAMGNLVVDSIRTKNIFGNYTIINGWISGTGMRVNSNNGNRMAFVKCKPNTTYTISRSIKTSTFRIGEYTIIPPMTSSNVDYTLPKTIIEDNNANSITYTTGSTAEYLIVHYGLLEDTNLKESLSTIQVEEGDTATSYSPYQNLTGEENYTTEEQVIGTWIDGKPLYRKVYKVENQENSYGIARPSNVDTFTKLSVMQKDSSNAWIPAYYWTSSDYLRIFATGDYIQIRTSKANNTFIHYIIIEYTKTTD